jgi:hypothetical protein
MGVQEETMSSGFPVLPQLIFKVLGHIWEAVQEGGLEWVVRQNELVAGLWSRGPEAQESPATEDTIHFKERRRKWKEGHLCVEEPLAIESYCPS